MSDAETQEAINEVLREIVERLDEKWECRRRKRNRSERRQRERSGRPLRSGVVCCEGRMHAYSRAKRIVREYIERPPSPTGENDPTLGERSFEIKKLPKE
jgi:hypothetical protein